MNNKPVSRKKDIVIQELNGEVLVYDLKDNKAFCLNETAASVWQMCDGNTSISEISENLSKKLKSDVNEDLVWLAIDQLKTENLIANGDDLVSSFEGMNRRDVIKKVGLASMIALPVIAGLVAPAAVSAASTCVSAPQGTVATNGACTQSCACQTGCCRATGANAGTCQTQLGNGSNCVSGGNFNS